MASFVDLRATEPTAWQLLNDGDPSPSISPIVFDTVGSRVLLFAQGTANSDSVDGPAINWELVGDDWVRKFPIEPTPKRHGASCATFDTARSVSVLFGAGEFRNETWEFDGTTWTKRLPAASPPGRAACGLVYDASVQRSVLFGGYSLTLTALGDTWEWDGNNWTQVVPMTLPPPRQQPGLAYDAQRERVVLFGGRNGTLIYGDTWLYDTSRGRWQQKTPSPTPSPRAGSAMAYDSVRQRVVLFGGASFTTGFTESWEWNGTSWTQVATGQAPGARIDSHMVFDPTRSAMVDWGGYLGGNYFNDTWSYDGVNWSRIADSGLPSPRGSFGMTYDPDIGGLVLYGGELGTTQPPNGQDDTWHYVNGIWTDQTAAGVPTGIESLPLTYDPTAASVVGFSGLNDLVPTEIEEVHTYGGSPALWNSAPSFGPTSRGQHAWVYSAARAGIIMFGGHACCDSGGHDYTAGDTWVLSSGTWTEVFGPDSPEARRAPAFTYDSLRGRVLLYGGSGAVATLGDTWELDDDGWNLVQAASPPGSRARASMTYDAARDMAVLYGSGPLVEGVTWEFDGVSWIAHSTPFQPESSRAFFQMAYDPIKEVTYLFGGRDFTTATYFNDTWAYGPDDDADGFVGKLDNCTSIANPNQANADGDAAGDVCDCAAGNPGSFAMPVEVPGLAVSGSAPSSLTWADQTALVGPGVRYDVVKGSLGALRATGDFSAATCLASLQTVPSASDPAIPAPGEGVYYLVRSRNACGLGSYGAVGLDAASPCP